MLYVFISPSKWNNCPAVLWTIQSAYSRVPIRKHGTFTQHTPFIRPNTFPKKWAMSFNWISMSKWSTFRYKFVSINLHLLYRPRHMWLIFRPIHFSSCVPLRLFRTPLLIGTREYITLVCIYWAHVNTGLNKVYHVLGLIHPPFFLLLYLGPPFSSNYLLLQHCFKRHSPGWYSIS